MKTNLSLPLALAAFLVVGAPMSAAGATVAPQDECGVGAMTVGEVRALPAERRMAVVACLTRVAAAPLAAKMPMKVDEVTVLTSVVADGVTLRYDYTANVDGAAITQEQKAGLLQSTRDNVCKNKDMVGVMSMGGVYAYVWRDRKKDVITSVSFSAC